ncbi:restriction endonuclease subunit S [Weizmannia sp. CD-2023]|uniref:restriction endonuclease subunit S n=1 Tax=Heyndrickxia TaxID=2837504 RepID=UPI001459B62D|nr:MULTISPECIES: restriction endonuclease subunit S [Heyndrickxia]MED4841687.1 restriction endonuclease subunit S [Weizmannia sp. CD-2023]MED4901036.1 restriction endonuclease subunit S [Weizmannia sp. CD-2023]NMH83124.1 restriction endonuclease subunit S [Heyndrickxia coagulans]
MEQKNLVPKRRFKEFQNTSAWEQRKLGDVVDVRSGRDYKHLSEGNIPVYGTGGYMLSVSEALSYTEDAIGIGRKGTIDKPYILRAPFWTVDTLFYAVPKEKYNLDFVHSVFQRVNWKQKDESTGVPSLSKMTINTVRVAVPEFEEQVKIGLLFNQLDNLITLHQRKLEKMKALKSAYLSEMFPAEGERVPKRRFAGFTQPWEQRKFIELLDVKDGIRRGPFGSALKKDLFVPKSDYVVYEQQNAIYDKWETRYYITKEKFEELHKFVLSEGDFIMSGAGTIGRIAKVPKGIKKGVFNQALIRFKINPELTDSNYFLEWIRSNEMQRKFTGSNPGSAMTNLVPMSEVKEWVISLPSLAEQKKIGDFFAELSDIITLHQRKLEKLQNIKKAYLNEMFV